MRQQVSNSKFVKKINVKQRQFNFTADQIESPVKELQSDGLNKSETQICVYEPINKKIKLENGQPFQLPIPDINPNQSLILEFLSKLHDFKLPTNENSTDKLKNQEEEEKKKKKLIINDKIVEKQQQSLKKILLNHELTNKPMTIPQQLDFTFEMPEQEIQIHHEISTKILKELSDSDVFNISKGISKMDKQNTLNLNLLKKWNVDDSNLSDRAVENLSQGLQNLQNITELELGLYGWGYWNQNITNSAMNHISNALKAMNQLNALKLDLNMWAYQNDKITDQGSEALLDGISQLKDLGKLEINMKGWGDSNENITDQTIVHLSKCLRKLDNLSELKLVLWDKISKETVKKLNKSLQALDNLTKIDVKFERLADFLILIQSSSSQIQNVENPNWNSRLKQIKEKAGKKRKLLFQTEAIRNVYQNIFRKEKNWDIIQRLI